MQHENKGYSGDKASITFINRKELLCTYDLNLASRITDVLDKNKIPYQIKTRFIGSMNRKTGSIKAVGEQIQHEVEKKIFVHGKDIEIAKHVIKTCFL